VETLLVETTCDILQVPVVHASRRRCLHQNGQARALLTSFEQQQASISWSDRSW